MSPDPSEEQDGADMARLAAGHDAALNDLMARHSERLFHYLIRQLGNEGDAADLAQETFARVYQHRTRFKAGSRFSTWLYTIATNLVRDRFRWRSRHPEVSIDAESLDGSGSLADVMPERGPGPSENIQLAERAEAVRRAVSRLPEDLRTPLLLSEYEELSHTEIGAILGCTAKAVESRVYRARQQLRERLAPEIARQ
jgi:RNA polymerase sigma-70 factor (ECF subfamily)